MKKELIEYETNVPEKRFGEYHYILLMSLVVCLGAIAIIEYIK